MTRRVRAGLRTHSKFNRTRGAYLYNFSNVKQWLPYSTLAAFKINGILRHQENRECNQIPTRVSTTRSNSFYFHQNGANLHNCIPISTYSPILVRITSCHKENSAAGYNTRNSMNLININIAKQASKSLPRLRLATWNAHSLNKKAASICDLIISKRIDILSLTETWLSGNNSDCNVAEILNTLQDFEFLHLPRIARKGGGVGVLLRKGFNVKQNAVMPFNSMEYVDLSIGLLQQWVT